jgi:hypothetical protein
MRNQVHLLTAFGLFLLITYLFAAEYVPSKLFVINLIVRRSWLSGSPSGGCHYKGGATKVKWICKAFELLLHQLFLDDTDVALLLFDCSDPNDPFRGVPYWAKVLKKHAPSHVIKLLVSARCDVSPITVDQQQINEKLAKYELNRHFNQYAASIIQAARNHPVGIGAVSERDLLIGNLSFSGFERLPQEQEMIVLEATAELLIRHDLCFREMGFLVFPSQINVIRPAPLAAHPRSESNGNS